MQNLLLLAFTFFFSNNLFAQINSADSTVQIIGYWDLHEKQTYAITSEKYKITDTDTTAKQQIIYEVDITIQDSTANSYTIEWLYKNFQSDLDNPVVKRMASLSQNMRVVIKTDEMGMIQEVVNWEEVRDYLQKATNQLKQDFKDTPKINEIVDQAVKTFATKEAIELSATKDMKQFYSFHGAKYTLGEELNAQMKGPNMFGGEPFDIDVTLLFDEIDEEDDTAILRLWQTADPKQLTDAVYTYLKDMAKSLGTDPPQREDIPLMKNETRTASKIHGSGWVIYSVETKEVTGEGTTNIEERTIELL